MALSNFLCCFDVMRMRLREVGLVRGLWVVGGRRLESRRKITVKRRLRSTSPEKASKPNRNLPFNCAANPLLLTLGWHLNGNTIAKIHLRCYTCASPKGLYARNNVYNPPLSETGQPK